MAKKTITELKEYFEAGKRPTENQFEDLIDSYVHIDNLSEYSTFVEFPADYQVGDYIEFLQFEPAGLGAGGFFEVSVVYTRNSTASAATHIAAVSHANPDLWKECGTVNKNNYVDGIENNNLTVDINGGVCRFRIRAIHTYGAQDELLRAFIKIRSINRTEVCTVIDNRGNDTAPIPLQPMSNEWNLWVGNLRSSESAKIGLKVNIDGNVGIGTNDPMNKLDVRGTVFAGSSDGTQGINAFAIRYEDGSLNNWGSLRSSAETYMSYGVRANPYGSLQWLSTNGTFPHYNTAIIAGNEGVKFLASDYGQTAFDYPVNMSELMRINPNGNVGIGTILPYAKLHINSTYSLPDQLGDFIIGNIDFPNIRFGTNSQYTWIQSHSGAQLHINPLGSNIILNKNAGNVGIGVDAPQSKLEVSGFVTSRIINDTVTPSNIAGFNINQLGANVLEMSFARDGQGLGVIKTLSDNPLTIGTNNVERIRVQPVTGNVGIGTKNPDQKLTVKGKIHAEDVIVDTNIPADYVFQKYYDNYSSIRPDYQMLDLVELESYIKQNRHLPEISSGETIMKNGVEIGDFQMKLLQKIEELTLYLIYQNKEIENLKKVMNHA